MSIPTSKHPPAVFAPVLAALAALAAFVLALPALGQFVEPDVTVLHTFVGDEVGDGFGWVSERVGDVDGDGVSELIISAPFYFGDGVLRGRAYLYRADGTLLNVVTGADFAYLGYSVNGAGDVDADGIPDYIVGGRQVLVFSGRDHSLIHDLSATTGFGHDVAGAGDVDGDGHADLFVGSQGTSVPFTRAGRVYVLSGRDGTVIWTRDGGGDNHFLGSGVGLVGDVDRDGVPDLVAGAMGAGPAGGGEAYLLSGADGSLRKTLEADPDTAASFGQFFASGAGDVDADGFPDVYVGDYSDGFGGVPGTGRAYVFSGKSGRPLHVLHGLHPGDGFGDGRGAGDLDGDGHGDLLIAAYTNSDGAPQAGQAYVFSGRSGALLRTMTADVAGDNFGVDAMAAGDADGDGLTDFLITSVGLAFAGLDTGRAYLLAGTVLPCVSDLDGDGSVGPADLILLNQQIGGGGPADLNGDGAVDRLDRKVLLRDFGPCPSL